MTLYFFFVQTSYIKKYKYFFSSRFFTWPRKIFWKPERTFFIFIQNFSFHKKEKEKEDGFFSLLLVGRLLHSERCREECTAKPSSNRPVQIKFLKYTAKQDTWISVVTVAALHSDDSLLFWVPVNWNLTQVQVYKETISSRSMWVCENCKPALIFSLEIKWSISSHNFWQKPGLCL